MLWIAPEREIAKCETRSLNDEKTISFAIVLFMKPSDTDARFDLVGIHKWSAWTLSCIFFFFFLLCCCSTANCLFFVIVQHTQPHMDFFFFEKPNL